MIHPQLQTWTIQPLIFKRFPQFLRALKSVTAVTSLPVFRFIVTCKPMGRMGTWRAEGAATETKTRASKEVLGAKVERTAILETVMTKEKMSWHPRPQLAHQSQVCIAVPGTFGGAEGHEWMNHRGHRLGGEGETDERRLATDVTEDMRADTGRQTFNWRPLGLLWRRR